MIPDINYLAVLASAIMAIVLGSLWFGPLFGNQWMKLMDMKKPATMTAEMKSAMMKSYALMSLGSLVMAFVLAHVITFAMAYTNGYGLKGGLIAACWIWLGFFAPVVMGDQLWGSKSWKLFPITGGYYLVSLLLMSAILAMWR